MATSVFSLAAGIILLLFGRRLFWLFVGCIGFVAGFYSAGAHLVHQPEWMALVIGLAVGVIGAFIAVFLQHIAIGLSGFGAGGMIAVRLTEIAGIQTGPFFWGTFFIGGIIGLILLMLFFDWALILLSSMVGSAMVTGFFHIAPPLNLAAFVALVAVGILVQAKLSSRYRRPGPNG
jgi:MFS family permease